MILGDYFHFGKLNLTILKATQVSKVAGIGNLSGRFLNYGVKFLSKPINDLYNLSITPEKFPGSSKVAKLNPLYKMVL